MTNDITCLFDCQITCHPLILVGTTIYRALWIWYAARQLGGNWRLDSQSLTLTAHAVQAELAKVPD